MIPIPPSVIAGFAKFGFLASKKGMKILAIVVACAVVLASLIYLRSDIKQAGANEERTKWLNVREEENARARILIKERQDRIEKDKDNREHKSRSAERRLNEELENIDRINPPGRVFIDKSAPH